MRRISARMTPAPDANWLAYVKPRKLIHGCGKPQTKLLIIASSVFTNNLLHYKIRPETFAQQGRVNLQIMEGSNGNESLKWNLSETKFEDGKRQNIRWLTFLNAYKGKAVAVTVSMDGGVLKVSPANF